MNSCFFSLLYSFLSCKEAFFVERERKWENGLNIGIEGMIAA